jgi:hypothetical protein
MPLEARAERDLHRHGAAKRLGHGVPTGTVTFLDGSTSLGTAALNAGVATLTTSALSAGTHQIVAAYSGDTNFNPNDAAPLVQTLNP